MCSLQKTPKPTMLDDRSRKKVRFRNSSGDGFTQDDSVVVYNNPSFKATVLGSDSEEMLSGGDDDLVEGAKDESEFEMECDSAESDEEDFEYGSIEEMQDLIAVAAWVRFPGIPLHMYHKSILKRITSLIGRMLKIDHNTGAEKRGKFARVTVELDLSEPLTPKFFLNGKEQKIVYEGLPQVCFTCGVFGHTK
ncbi:Uncharacterized protein TCM_015964 [Theobroma cacao]|uniref:Uncharacterized protein n=1 Tax=Theobroma cacao TaxID=3641 RepID=A0A061G434_THECC|nr:Uncharacterized protein TCM_015964 [Theobroma cacao]